MSDTKIESLNQPSDFLSRLWNATEAVTPGLTCTDWDCPYIGFTRMGPSPEYTFDIRNADAKLIKLLVDNAEAIANLIEAAQGHLRDFFYEKSADQGWCICGGGTEVGCEFNLALAALDGETE